MLIETAESVGVFIAMIVAVMAVDISDAKVRTRRGPIHELAIDPAGFWKAVFLNYGLPVAILGPFAAVLALGGLTQPKPTQITKDEAID